MRNYTNTLYNSVIDLAYFYVDGVQAGPPVTMKTSHLNTLRVISLGGHQYTANDRCHCYLADIILLNKRMSNSEIREEYEKYMIGDGCPITNVEI